MAKQKTRPKKGRRIEIPVPKRGDFERLLKKAALPEKVKKSAPGRKRAAKR